MEEFQGVKTKQRGEKKLAEEGEDGVKKTKAVT